MRGWYLHGKRDLILGMRIAVLLLLFSGCALHGFTVGDDMQYANLLTQVRDDNPIVRAAALRKMAYLSRNDDIHAALLAALADQNPTVRSTACWALHYDKSLAIIDALVPLLADAHFEVRANAAITLGLRCEPRAVPILLDALRQAAMEEGAASLLGYATERSTTYKAWAEKSLCEQIMDALASFNDAVLKDLTSLHDDNRKEIRLSGVLTIGLISTENAVTALKVAITDTDDDVRIAAIQMLGMLALRLHDNTKAVAELRSLLAEPSAPVRLVALAAISRYVDTNDIPQLEKLLHDPDTRIRSLATKTLGHFEDTRALNLLSDKAKDPDPQVRTSAIASLGNKHDPMVVFPLLAAIDDPVPEVRRTAMLALARTHDARAIQPLKQALSSPVPGDQYTAAIGLAELQDAAGLTLLLHILSTRNRGYDSFLPSQIAMIGEDATEKLCLILDERDIIGTIRAIKALGIIGDSRAVPSLLVFAKSPQRAVAASAVVALGKIGDTRATPVLLDILQAYDPAKYLITLGPGMTVEREANGGLSKEVAPYVRQSISDAQGDLRNLIANALGKIGDPRAIPQLMPLLSDTVTLENAAKALCIIDKSAAATAIMHNMPSLPAQTRPLLLSILADCVTPDTQETIARFTLPYAHTADVASKVAVVHCLSRSTNPEARRALLQMYEETDKRVKLAVLNDTQGHATSLLLKALYENDEEVRAVAVQRLALFFDSEIEHALLGMATDTNMIVRENVIRALASSKHTQALSILKAALKDSVLAEAAIESLGMMGEQGASELLPLLNDESLDLRTDVTVALGKTKSKQAVEPIISQMNNADIDLLSASIQSLGEIGDARAVTILLPYLGCHLREIRSQAALALGNIGDTVAADSLLVTLSDKDSIVRTSTVTALGMINAPHAATQIIERLQLEYHPAVKAEAAKVLGSLNASQAMPSLIGLLHDENQRVRQNAYMALKKLSGQDYGIAADTWQQWYERKRTQAANQPSK